MTTETRTDLVRRCFDAYESGDRAAIEALLADDFTFSSPADVGIDRTRYFERCWPNSGNLAAYAFRRLAPVGDELLVTYEAQRIDGSRFCNTEIFGFTDDQIASVEVYFGWNL
jgi:hypothetical protein